MKALKITSLLTALILALLLLHAVDLLGTFSVEDFEDVETFLAKIQMGHVYVFFTQPLYWKTFPSVSLISVLSPSSIMLLMFALNALLISILYSRFKKSLLLPGWLCMATSLVPICIGYFSLHNGNIPLEECGPKIAWMLLGPLYACLIATVLFALSLRQSDQSAPEMADPAP